MDDITVAVEATDPITRIGLVGALRMGSKVDVVGPTERNRAQVLVFGTDRLTLAATARLRHDTAQTVKPVVLVADDLADDQLLAAVKCGVVAALLRSSISVDRLTDYVVTAAQGGAALPPTLLGNLFKHVSHLHHDLTKQRDANQPELTHREVDVLRLLADGHSTSEIGAKLSYSERTIKNILSTILTKRDLRNRAHAVAYALRSGVL